MICGQQQYYAQPSQFSFLRYTGLEGHNLKMTLNFTIQCHTGSNGIKYNPLGQALFQNYTLSGIIEKFSSIFSRMFAQLENTSVDVTGKYME